jgi:hypothetical protein
MSRKLKFKDINGDSKTIVAEDVEQFSHGFDERSKRDYTDIEIGGNHIFADCHILDFTRALFAAT